MPTPYWEKYCRRIKDKKELNGNPRENEDKNPTLPGEFLKSSTPWEDEPIGSTYLRK